MNLLYMAADDIWKQTWFGCWWPLTVTCVWSEIVTNMTSMEFYTAFWNLVIITFGVILYIYLIYLYIYSVVPHLIGMCYQRILAGHFRACTGRNVKWKTYGFHLWFYVLLVSFTRQINIADFKLCTKHKQKCYLFYKIPVKIHVSP